MPRDETPEEKKLRRRREAQQRYRDRQREEAGNPPPRYTPLGPGETRRGRRKEQNREASRRYLATDWGAEQAALRNQSPEHRVAQNKYNQTPKAKAAKVQSQRERRAFQRHLKDTEGKREPEVADSPFRPGGDPEAARANRERIAAETKKRMPAGPQLHPQRPHFWWRKPGE